jgi:hypothetical protein
MTDAPRIHAIVPSHLSDWNRYLDACIEHGKTFADHLWEWPDTYGDMMLHEGAWRTRMLEELTPRMDAQPGVDWILVNDSDEFLASTNLSELTLKEQLHSLVAWANELGADSMLLGIDELWSLDPPLKRVDKAWGTISGLRLFRYEPGMPMAVENKKLASGSVPVWARNNSLNVKHNLKVVHASYAFPADREAKFARYQGRPEHGSAHVNSILDTDVDLQPLGYECPKIWRGIRNG